MRLITRRTVERFADDHADSRDSFADWCAMVEAAQWRDADHLRASSHFPARALGGKRVVFNVKGNRYRVICSIQYSDSERGFSGIVRVHFVGTHAEYDAINAETVVFDATRS